ncbi:hypothetical protein LPJ75_006124, partial [Coemansia sp. RSA 2598]
MSVFENLPFLVRALVLDYAIDSCSLFSEKLVFLSVCQSWRTAALASVYRIAHAKGARIANRAANKPRYSVVWKTNIDLIAMTDSAASVRTMFVEVQRDHMLLDLANTLCQTAMFRETPWPGIRRLCVVTHMHSVSLSDDEADSDDEDVTDSTNDVLKQAADALIKCLPGVTEVEFNAGGCGLRHMCFCGHLASGYARQLAKVVGSSWVFLPLARSLDFLAVLDLDLSISFEPLFPRISPERLRVMRLKNTPPFFSWGVFGRPGSRDSEPVVFGSLVALEFHMNQHVLFEDLSDFEEEYEFSGQVMFPKLQTLCMKSWPRLGAHFGNCVFPQQMHRVVCFDSTRAFAEITDMQPICIAECLDITATVNGYIDYEFSSIMELYAVQGKRAPRRVELTLENTFEEVGPRLLSWTAVTRLGLQSAGFDQLLLLLRHLTRLDRLD